ncbi:MAG: hypothetical protein NC489_29715 [Ruminococcus flavefaciens]|nr:hypothetical protein [Ruminococcus flavefaciens]
MQTIIVNDAIVLEQVKKHVGKVEEFFTAKMDINGKRINVTYDCKKNNLIIHEWYELKPDTLELVTLLISTCFNRIMAQEIFPAAVIAIDRYTAELEMDFPAAEIERRNTEMLKMLAKIDKMGLSEEFAEYACLA